MSRAAHENGGERGRDVKTTSRRHHRKEVFVYGLLAIIIAYTLAYSFVFISGPSFFGDDTVYLNLAYSVLKGNFLEGPFIFSTRILQFYPTALLYALFGTNLYTDSGWDIIAFAGTVLVTFYLGKELYNEYAGLIAALLLSFFPRIVILASTISEDVTMTFFSALLILFIIYAEKRESAKWYFVAGLLLITPFLVTPEGFITIVVAVVYLLIEILRRKIKINKISLFFIYGILVSGALLLIYNYFYTNPHQPFVTLTTNLNFYSAVGGPNHIPSTNTDLRFYLQQIFPYNVIGNLASAISRLDFNPISIWHSIFQINYNKVGFYFYVFVIAALYLILRLERRSYVPLLWFAVGFAYLEFGPMHVGLHPFEYLLSYRLGRFLTPLTVPVVLAIAFAITRSVEKKSMIKRPIAAVLAVLAVLFLILTSLPISIFWHNATVYETFDQRAIANYIYQLPQNVKIYYSGAFAMTPIFAHFDNISRFYAYDGISNCSDIPVGAYVELPKYQPIFGINYTLYPDKYCPGWKLVLYPTIKGNYSASIVSTAMPFGARLYYVQSNQTYSSQSTSNSTTTTTTTTSSTTVTTVVNTSNSTQFNFFNLTGVGLINATSRRIEYFIIVNNVSSVYVSANRTSASPGEQVMLNVTFSGHFGWGSSNMLIQQASNYYLNSPLINVHYYGVELSNQSGMLLDQNNGPWNLSITQIGEPHQHIYKSPANYLRVTWIISPTQREVGKTLKLCGGYFATYENTTLFGGWGDAYDNLSYHQTQVINGSIINIPSSNCAYLQVI